MRYAGSGHAVATAAAIAFGLVVGNTVPLVVAAFVADGDASYVTAGNLVSVEFATMALLSLGLAPFVARLSLRWLASAGAVLAVVSQVASMFLVPALVPTLTAVIAFRILAGAAGGIVVCAGNAAIARTASPTRVYAVASLIGASVSAGLAATLPGGFPDWRAAIFVALAAAAGVVALLGLWMDSRRLASRLSGGKAMSLQRIDRAPAAMVLFAATLVLSTSLGSLWAFAELLGTNLGFDAATVGRILALNLLAGLGGGLAAAMIGERIGTWGPLLAGILLLAVCALGLAMSRSLTFYAIAMLAYGFGYFFTMTFLMSTAARLDATGRVAALTGGIVLVGFAVGPVLGGHIAETLGTRALGLLVAAGLTIAWVLAGLARRQPVSGHINAV